MDIAKLLEPVSSDSPTGEDLRYVDGDLTFQNIEELRREEDPALAVEGNAKTADWKKVVQSCEEALASRSKDLQLAAWLCEGLAHREGFSGVRDGLRLTKELIETFWDRLHPGFEDGEIVLPIRAKPLAWLTAPRCFLPAVKAVPFVTGHAERPLSWADRELAERVDELRMSGDPAQLQDLTESGAVSGEIWKGALMNTPLEKLQETLGLINECAGQLEELRKVCDERFGGDAPTLAPLDDLFGEMRAAVERAVGSGEETEAAAEGAAAEGGPARVSGPIASRRQALQQLAQVASFFRQTEPHSPISYLVQRAVRWGDMPLEDLLKEVVKSSDALERIWDTLGIAPPRDEE